MTETVAVSSDVTTGVTGDNTQGDPIANQNVNWRDSLPETLREAPFLKAANTPEDAFEQIKNAAAHMGNSVRFPGEDASPEVKQEFLDKITAKSPELMLRPNEGNQDKFWNSLGRPESPDKYNLDLAEGEELPSDFSSFAEVAHKYGLTQDQFRGVVKEVVSGQQEQMSATEAQQKTEMSNLAKEWGQAYDQNVAQVKNFLRLTDAPEGIVELISEGAMSPQEIKWIHSVATATRSPVELATQKQEQQNALTPMEAHSRIQEMLNNHEHPYWNQTDPRHKDAVNKMLEYQSAAHPEPRGLHT